MGVMGGKLGIDALPPGEKKTGACQVGDIRRLLAGKHRVTFEPKLLGMFNLHVPVGSLHQPHRQAAVDPDGQIMNPLESWHRLFRVGLNHQAKTAPTGNICAAQRRSMTLSERSRRSTSSASMVMPILALFASSTRADSRGTNSFITRSR